MIYNQIKFLGGRFLNLIISLERTYYFFDLSSPELLIEIRIISTLKMEQLFPQMCIHRRYGNIGYLVLSS